MLTSLVAPFAVTNYFHNQQVAPQLSIDQDMAFRRAKNTSEQAPSTVLAGGDERAHRT